MTRFWTIILCLMTTGILLGPVQPAQAAGQAAAYLREGVGARALALGNAGTVISRDASAVYWNPAVMTQLPESANLATQTAILGMHRSWNFISYARKNVHSETETYAYAGSWISFSAGDDIEQRSSNRPEPDALLRDSQNVLIVSAAGGNSFSAFGMNLKYLMHSLGDDSGDGFGLDLGYWFKLGEYTEAGVVCQDLYSGLNWSEGHSDRLPLYTRIGVAHRLPEYRLLLAVELGLEFFHAAGTVRDVRYHGGAEYMVIPKVAVRAGIDTGRWTAGAGWQFQLGSYALVHLDYALAGERMPGEGLMHFISLSADF